ncbi:GNAT family N-acetyltransferase [Candidatus Avelusimicrobium stercoris]|uniref:GNAT family N-acetyltransferase n=1 Tax=Candidatus Avelusimicrobium stercoris TaxID=1947924 RepID=UPI003D1238EF
MKIRLYNTLPNEAKKIRTEVFIQEQHFTNEFDDTDQHATHLVLYENTTPVATARYYNTQNTYIIGRVAVSIAYRGKGLGQAIITNAENAILQNHGRTVMLLAQTSKQAFYQKLGYKPFGEIIYDEYCPHIWMKKELLGGE